MSQTYPYPLAATGSSFRSLPQILNFEKPQVHDFSRLSTYLFVPGRLYSDERQESFYNISFFATENQPLLHGSRPDPTPTRPAALTTLSPLQRHRSPPPLATATNDNHRTFQRLGSMFSNPFLVATLP